MKVSFVENTFKNLTLKQVRELYRSDKVLLAKAERYWREVNKKGLK
jgi:hypothetical protein